jgi:hypothetical protein
LGFNLKLTGGPFLSATQRQRSSPSQSTPHQLHLVPPVSDLGYILFGEKSLSEISVFLKIPAGMLNLQNQYLLIYNLKYKVFYMKVYQKNALNLNMPFVYLFASRIMLFHDSLYLT